MAARPRRDAGPVTSDWRAHYQALWTPMATTTTQPRDRMPLPEFLAARQVLRNALAQFPEPTCRSCVHFDMGRCKQYDQDIPADFQQKPEACEGWEFDGIPFVSSAFVHDTVTSKQRRMKSYDF